MPTPEELTRKEIDALLLKCGWKIQDYKQLDLSAGRGIAIREGRRARCLGSAGGSPAAFGGPPNASCDSPPSSSPSSSAPAIPRDPTSSFFIPPSNFPARLPGFGKIESRGRAQEFR
jgi:hypothetical protein